MSLLRESAPPPVAPRPGGRGGGARSALLLIDVINPMQFDGGERLFAAALPAARNIAALKDALRRRALPTIYVNDNFGCWDLGFRELVALHLRTANRGQPIIELLAPQPGDHFILKPKHSGFYGTSLELLLQHLRVRRLLLAGFATNICVWFTANDAHMRGYELHVPADCVAAETPADTAYPLEQMRRVMGADTRPTAELCLHD
ncbi:MAG: isochorismatase family cysteine hydrolase [Deltaproteobacteria bacterium]|nr:isochorismatase family cysteine hydrolase [Deltaproteobacteria bacterium]